MCRHVDVQYLFQEESMGVHVVLNIDPRGFDKTGWEQAYDDTLALLEAWQPPLLGWAVRTIDAEQVGVYARSIRHSGRGPEETGWSVVGDRESLQTGECQSLCRDLNRYLRRASRDSEVEDIVVAAARQNPSSEGRLTSRVRSAGQLHEGHRH
jgi:hypothetical protein